MNDKSWRRVCIDFLKSEFLDQLPIVEEYVAEAEHQDGRGYWGEFRTLEEVRADFVLYLDARED